jgi:squalene-hopene/tetraprenyl-beta-curcumene cyclase
MTEDGGPPPPPPGPDPIEGLPADWKAKAGVYLDTKSGAWITTAAAGLSNNPTCNTCHTTTPYMMALAQFDKPSTPNAAKVRASFVSRLNATKSYYGPPGSAKEKESFGTEAILNATSLAFGDLAVGTAISADSKAALDKMWSLQRADGAWDWLDYGLEPWEIRNDWGTAMAGLLAATIPQGTSAAQTAGTAKLIGYLKSRATKMAFHDKVMVLWTSGSLPGLMDRAAADLVADELSAKQLADGGFSIGSFGKGARAAAIANTSDGYATAFSVLALCKGTENGKDREDVKKGIRWLATHQDADGSWVGQSTNRDKKTNNQFMREAATGYAVLALTQCAK